MTVDSLSGMEILQPTKDPVVNLAKDTISLGKQALVFVNTKRSAEKVAEDVAKKTGLMSEQLSVLSTKVRGVLGRPTKQCERLAFCVKHGAAFHHSGLHSKQKELVEEAFRKGVIKIIGCTPTLAAGLDLPAFRAIIRDVKRYGTHGMAPIPVLEFLQMAGRAGRPKFDSVGEAVVVCNTEQERDFVVETYLEGVPEDIFSKLAVEPVLRTYLLSLISSRIIGSKESIFEFFSRTFWAFQFKDEAKIERIINRMLDLLIGWEFLQETDRGFRATLIGRRVAELYLDPLTAHNMMNGLRRGENLKVVPFSFLQMVCYSLEMRPLLRVRQREFDDYLDKLASVESGLLVLEPSMFEPEYEDWMNSIKTAFMLQDWIDERDEEFLLEEYDCRPGETRVKIANADWLLYACYELARMMNLQPLLKEIMKARLRLRYGVKEELLPLVRLQGVGRVRARVLFRNGLKDLRALKNAPIDHLSKLIGNKVAVSVKRQL